MTTQKHGADTDLFLSVGIDENVVSSSSGERLITDYAIDRADARDVLFTTDAVLQQTKTMKNSQSQLL